MGRPVRLGKLGLALATFTAILATVAYTYFFLLPILRFTIADPRMAANGSEQAAVLLRGQRRRAVCLRRSVDGWKDPSGHWNRSRSILTTTLNSVTPEVHDRMPVILQKDDYDRWLNPWMTKVEAVSDLLKPFEAHLMRAYPVSTRINQVQNDDEDCAKPITLDVLSQGQLFG